MKLAIIGAFDAEIEKLIDMFDLKKDPNSKQNVYIGSYDNKDLIVANSGIGKVNSGAMTQYLIDLYNPNYIINSGCAGSLTNDIKIMDIVISSHVKYHDFTPIRVMNYSVPDNGNVCASDFLIEIAKKALENINNTNYYIGDITSGDCFVTDSVMRDQIYQNTQALAVDMESASIGHIARKNEVPFIAIRTISDFADGNDDFEIEAAHNSSQIVKEIIKLIN